jgi:uncharacterized repeat protein (TIGR01451 family)
MQAESEKSRVMGSCLLFLWSILFLSIAVFAGSPSGYIFSIGNSNDNQPPYISGAFDAAGYSDGIYYGQSILHPYSSHELLSGEWGSAAVYYDGIDTEPLDPNNPTGPRQAMWLTNYFLYPYWTTNSKFDVPIDQLPQARDDSNNPITGCNDTAVSYLNNSRLSVQIDYEFADLEQSSGSVKRSPMAFFTDPNNPQPRYVYSDRYVFLQTYTLRNLDRNSAITNLEFYQMLHSHGANEYGPKVVSCYESAMSPDALATYTPHNPVHCTPGQSDAGNFHYDITQWNIQPYSTASHTDYVGFSCTRQPDWIDNDVYLGHNGRPSSGTIVHIENRQLNGVSYIKDEAAGAMGWYLGTLDPNEAVSITIAFMCGYGKPEEIDIYLTKDDDVPQGQKVWPQDEFVYTINWENYGSQAVTNAVLKDFLPRGVDFVEFVEQSVSPVSDPPADPNIVFDITDANGLDEIELTVGQSVRLYVNKETVDEDIYSFYLEAATSDPNLGWIDNTEYDPNNPGTAEILASPRDEFYDYYGPGYTQYEGIQFSAVSFGNVMQDGNLASFLYTATQPGYVTLTLLNYDTNPVTLESIVIRQADPNDPNNIPDEPNSFNEPPVYPESSPTGSYDNQAHTITWQLGDIPVGGSGSVEFRVRVNNAAEPGMTLHNIAVLTSGLGEKVATKDTPVACWDNDDGVIYVNQNAAGYDNGIDWQNAYTDLQLALTRKRANCEGIHTIYIAAGTYSPGREADDTFAIPDGVSVYGGFEGWETSPDQRQIHTYPTILTGIGGVHRNETVVTLGNNTLLDGVIMQDSGGTTPQSQGVLCEDVDAEIVNCTLRNNQRFGLLADNSNVNLKWCRIENNGYDGIDHIGNGRYIAIENCQINDNKQYGLYLEESVSVVMNTVICRNGIDGLTCYSVYMFNPSAPPTLYNNTIAFNYNEAIAYTDNNDPNHNINYPDIQNCIIWYNNERGDGEQFASWKVYPHYSCVYDPNDPDGESETIDWRNNFSHKPNFAYPCNSDPNVLLNIHLAPDSFCKEKGNPNNTLYTDQNDIDNENRVADTLVDVGADEISCSSVYNAFDWNADGIVNYGEINKFSQNWLAHDPNDPAIIDPNNPNYEYVTDPNSPGYIDPNRCENWYSVAYKYNLSIGGDSLYSIDTADLMVLVEDAPWLWIACWRHDIQEMQQMSMMMGGGEQMTMSSVPSVFSGPSQSAETTTFATVEPVDVALTADIIEPVEIDPAVERANILSLIDDIDQFINAGGEDAEAWQEMKILLEQSLVDIEDMINDPNKI